MRRAGDIRIRKLPCRVETIDKPAPDVAIVKLKLPANERLQYPRRPVHRSPAEGRPPPQLFARDAAARRCAARAAHPPRARTASSPTSCSTSSRAARSCASKVRSARSSCARSPTSRSFFVAGGTGFAPIKAVIEHALHHQIDQRRPMVLYWGVRAKRDLYLPGPARQMAAAEHQFHVHSRCCPIRRPTTRGRAARASSTRRCSTISPICRATRSTRAAARR